LVEKLLGGMLSDRVEELKQQGDCPIMFGGAGSGSLFGLRTKEAFSTFSLLTADGIEKGIRLMLTETERVRRHGYIASELERQKTKLLAELETRFNERSKTESKDITGKLVQNFLTQEAVPGIEWSYPHAKKVLPGITLEEVNEMAKKLILDRNTVMILTVQAQEGVDAPTKEALLAIYEDVKQSEITPYVETEDTRPLLPAMPSAGKVIDTKTLPGLGITEWKLANGARVILRPTDFKDDEIRFRAFSPGGTSRLSDSDYAKAWDADGIIGSSGAGQFKEAVLTKKLAGKVASIHPWISPLFEGLSGSCSPKDLETMLQLNYLYISAPRRDKQSFNSHKKMLSGFAAMSNSPDAAFRDSLTVLMAQGHPRRQPLTAKRVAELDLSTAYMFYLDRFMDVNDFTFVFVGNFEVQKIQPLIEQYIGGLPSSGRKEKWKDHGIHAPKGVVEKSFKLGSDPKSMVSLVFTGPMAYSEESQYNLQSMTSVLRIMLRESLREEKGGVYGVRASAKSNLLPQPGYRIDISFTCDPDRVDELVETAMEDIHNLRDAGPSEKNLQKIQVTQRRSLETDIRDNKYWLDKIQHYYSNNIEMAQMAGYPALIDGLDEGEVTKAANLYLNLDNYVKLVMYPEDKE
ncbi:MAG TPA: insulinase family protein, partial [Bacteroidetes bacterium]|nr:insulinase family protein [Bacteroidota bacterium]